MKSIIDRAVMTKCEDQIIIAALMPHAPVLVPALAGKRIDSVDSSVQAMSGVAERVVRAGPDAVVVISPHTPRRRGAFAIWKGQRIVGSLARFRAPEIRIELQNDLSLSDAIVDEGASRGLKIWELNDAEIDHGATVPLWHFVEAGWNGPTVLIGLNYPGEPGLTELGQAVAAGARRTNRGIAVIASGDMSHCLQPGAPAGFHPRADEFDRCFIECLKDGQYRRLEQLDPELQQLAAEDAVDSTLVAASAAGWNAAGHKVLSYEGPFGVGYGIAILYESSSTTARHEASREDGKSIEDYSSGKKLPDVARRSLLAAFRAAPDQPGIPAEGLLTERMGVFVTIRGAGEKLRGCIGTLTPRWNNVIEETWHVARDAAFRDFRFKPIEADEMEKLRFDVTLVSPPMEIASTKELDPKRFGVVVMAEDGRRGTLLPGIEGVDTVAQQLRVAREKGGIGPSEPIRIQRFAVKKFCD